MAAISTVLPAGVLVNYVILNKLWFTFKEAKCFLLSAFLITCTLPPPPTELISVRAVELQLV